MFRPPSCGRVFSISRTPTTSQRYCRVDAVSPTRRPAAGFAAPARHRSGVPDRAQIDCSRRAQHRQAELAPQLRQESNSLHTRSAGRWTAGNYHPALEKREGVTTKPAPRQARNEPRRTEWDRRMHVHRDRGGGPPRSARCSWITLSDSCESRIPAGVIARPQTCRRPGGAGHDLGERAYAMPIQFALGCLRRSRRRLRSHRFSAFSSADDSCAVQRQTRRCVGELLFLRSCGGVSGLVMLSSARSTSIMRSIR